MNETQEFDAIWENLYSQGHSQRYPWDAVVSFVFRNYPKHKSRQEVKILEVGCGSGGNLWFAAREGFSVSGIDSSPSAIAYAQNRFNEDNLTGDFQIGSFSQLPFKDDFFDLVIDRGAITCCGFSVANQAVSEIRRVLQIEGKFFCNPYSDRHSSYVSGKHGADGLIVEISDGTLTGVGQICFYGRRDVETLFAEGWNILSLQHLEWTEQSQPKYTVHAEWRVIAKK